MEKLGIIQILQYLYLSSWRWGGVGSSFAYLSKTNTIKIKHMHAYWDLNLVTVNKKEIENLILKK